MNLQRPQRCTGVVLGLCLGGTVCADVRFVDDDAAPGGNGLTWTSAFQHLQDAIAASGPGSGVTELRIAQGVYKPDRSAATPAGSGLRSATFQMPPAVACRGGYAGVGAADPDLRDVDAFITALSGDLSGNDGANGLNTGENSLHVATFTNPVAGTVIDGVSIIAGRADIMPADSRGGCVRGAGGGVSFINCTVASGIAQEAGGGVYWANGPANALTFTGCEFNDNRLLPVGGNDTGGGGLYISAAGASFGLCAFTGNDSTVHDAGAVDVIGQLGLPVHFSGCTFDSNHGERGGAISLRGAQHVVANCAFTSNSANKEGGAIYVDSMNSDNPWSNSQFVDNTAGTDGGALYLKYINRLVLRGMEYYSNSAQMGGAVACGGNAEIVHVGPTFIDNHATNDGGALHDAGSSILAIYNGVILRNSASGFGGALIDSGSSLVIRNTTIAANTANTYAGIYVYGDYDPYVQFQNSIIWGNQATTGASTQSSQVFISDPVNPNLLLSHNIIQYLVPGTGVSNLSTDPLFVNLPGDDVHLTAASVAIDSGDNFAVCGAVRVDHVGNPRYMDGDGVPLPRIDRGAFEFPGAIGPSGDTNCNAVVNVADLLSVINNWGTCVAWYSFLSHCPSDLNDDLTVNVLDLLGVINGWSR